MPNRSPILVGDRPNAPTRWIKTNISQSKARDLKLCPPDATMISYDLTWHHNIPWKTLKESWNIVFTFFDQETVSDYFNLLAAGNPTRADVPKLRKKLMDLKGGLDLNARNASGATYQKWMDRLSGGEGSLLGTFAEEKKLTSDDEEALYSIVAWQAWNIVEGPKENVRVEDPGSDDFDDFRFLDRSNYERFQRVYVLYEGLMRLSGQFAASKDAFCDFGTVGRWQTSFKETLEIAKPLAKAPLVMFDMSYWKVVVWQKQPIKAAGAAQNVYSMARNMGGGSPAFDVV